MGCASLKNNFSGGRGHFNYIYFKFSPGYFIPLSLNAMLGSSSNFVMLLFSIIAMVTFASTMKNKEEQGRSPKLSQGICFLIWLSSTHLVNLKT